MNNINTDFIKWNTTYNKTNFEIVTPTDIPFIIPEILYNINFNNINTYFNNCKRKYGFMDVHKMSDKHFIEFLNFFEKLLNFVNDNDKKHYKNFIQKLTNYRKTIGYKSIYAFARKIENGELCYIEYTRMANEYKFMISSYDDFIKAMYLSNITFRLLKNININGEKICK